MAVEPIYNSKGEKLKLADTITIWVVALDQARRRMGIKSMLCRDIYECIGVSRSCLDDAIESARLKMKKKNCEDWLDD